jgi:Xaa-Pro aminopeptidase
MLQSEGLNAVPESSFSQRRARLLGLLAHAKADALVFSHLPNIRYLTGFTGSNALLLASATGAVLYTDPRYEFQAAEEVDCKVTVARGDLWEVVIHGSRLRRVKVLGVEAEKMPHSSWQKVRTSLGGGVRLKDCSGMVEELRIVKSDKEIDIIRRSVALNSRAYEKTLRKIAPGMTEIEVVAELEYAMRRLGADGPAFETIVAVGARTALPHARPGHNRLKNNQLLLVDMGATLEGYASDMTRVVHLGRPGARAKVLYEAVLEAQLAAVQEVRPGIRCAEVDRAARNVLRRGKLDRYFTHSTGHGLGLEIHEAPRVGARVETVLEAGMVITIEPGVYIEDFGGVRIEDTVLVTEKGVEVLTPTTKEFLVLAT